MVGFDASTPHFFRFLLLSLPIHATFMVVGLAPKRHLEQDGCADIDLAGNGHSLWYDVLVWDWTGFRCEGERCCNYPSVPLLTQPADGWGLVDGIGCLCVHAVNLQFGLGGYLGDYRALDGGQ